MWGNPVVGSLIEVLERGEGKVTRYDSFFLNYPSESSDSTSIEADDLWQAVHEPDPHTP